MSKSSTATNTWEKVFVLAGEPCMCEIGLQTALENKGPRTRRISKADGVEALSAALNAFSFETQPDNLVLIDPSNDMLKACLARVESGKFTPSALIVYLAGEWPDERTSFMQAAKKQKRVFEYPYVDSTDNRGLNAYLKDWESGMGLTMAVDAKQWLLAHAPTTLAKVKTKDGKREMETFDLLGLERELDKVASVRHYEGGNVTLHDVQELCQFDHQSATWALVADVTSGKFERILERLDELDISQREQGPLWVLLNQLQFSLVVKGAARRSKGIDDIQAYLSKQEWLGLLADDWSAMSPTPPPTPPHTFRIKKTMEDPTPIGALARQYVATACAILDLRYGLEKDIAKVLLALALSGRGAYAKPLLAV